MEPWRIIITLVAISIALTMVVASGEDKKTKEKEVCIQERMDIAKCYPFMKGQAKSPTSDCCSNLKGILNSDKNCICVIIQDRNDPDLGFQINVTLSFSLPSICHVTANVSKCPAFLHLDPNSPEAQVFYQVAKALNQIGPASAPETTSMPPTTGPGFGHHITSLSTAQSFHKQWLGFGVIVHFFFILYFIIFI